MDTLVNSPQVCESRAIIGALEDQVADEGGLVNQSVDEEFNFIEDTDMVLLVLDLEVAIFRSRVIHVDHILAVDQLSELLVASSASPCSVVEGASGDYLVGICRVGSGYIW